MITAYRCTLFEGTRTVRTQVYNSLYVQICGSPIALRIEVVCGYTGGILEKYLLHAVFPQNAYGLKRVSLVYGCGRMCTLMPSPPIHYTV